ncbi:hypothetical protein O3P69_010466 [Scylla paramamosain]|uniref:Uncharacterized protein n=1 Tax=Scylla paramamosain TaxID=85552 RepID=A0AAW0TTF5_SCYPA
MVITVKATGTDTQVREGTTTTTTTLPPRARHTAWAGQVSRWWSLCHIVTPSPESPPPPPPPPLPAFRLTCLRKTPASEDRQGLFCLQTANIYGSLDTVTATPPPACHPSPCYANARLPLTTEQLF